MRRQDALHGEGESRVVAVNTVLGEGEDLGDCLALHWPSQAAIDQYPDHGTVGAN